MKSTSVLRRRFLFSAVLLLMIFTAACGGGEATNGDESDNNEASPDSEGNSMEDTDSITFVAWGGSTQEGQEEAWAEPFTEETGITVNSDNTDYGQFKAMVESGNVTWDVVDVEADFAYKAAEEGLLEEIDFDIVDKDSLDQDFVSDHFVGSFAYSFVNAYNTDKISEEPNGWESFFDPDNFPGKRTAYQWPTAGIFEMALLADGVDPDDLYPIDFGRAFDKMDEIKDSFQWWETGAESQQFLASGEVSMGHVWNGRIYSIIEEGADVDIDWEQNIKAGDVLVVPKGTKNKEAAMEFIATATSAEGQADMANNTGYTPINTEADELVDDDLRKYLSSEHEDSQVVLDMEYWSTEVDEILPDWDAWLLE